MRRDPRRDPGGRARRDRRARAAARAAGHGGRDRRLGRRDRDPRPRTAASNTSTGPSPRCSGTTSPTNSPGDPYATSRTRTSDSAVSSPRSRTSSSATGSGSARSGACGETAGAFHGPGLGLAWYSTTRDSFLCALLSVVDITERRRTEEALQLSRGKLQEAIEFMPDATFIVDRERQVVAWNRAMESLSGIGREDVTGTRDYGRAFARFGGRLPGPRRSPRPLDGGAREDLPGRAPVRRDPLLRDPRPLAPRRPRRAPLGEGLPPLRPERGRDRGDPDPARHLGLEAGRGVVPLRRCSGESRLRRHRGDDAGPPSPA